MTNHELMTDLLVMALACDQTRVFNMMFNNGASSLTRIGSTITHHQLTHEEVLDNRLGYQPEATYFLTKIMEAWVYFVAALDKVKEGDAHPARQHAWSSPTRKPSSPSSTPSTTSR